MIIDANLYWIPEKIFLDETLMKKFLSEVPGQFGWYGRCEDVPGANGKKQVVLEKPLGSPNLNYVQGDYVLETMLGDLDEAGVDKAILKVPGCHEWMGLEMCRLFNDGMHEYEKASGGRLIPLAVVPPYGTPESLAELERCKNELGMKAVQVSAHYGETYLDDEKFSAFFEKVNELRMNVYVHHTPIPAEYKSFCDYNNVRRSYGRCVDQGLAVGREVFSGFFERYPNIKMVHSMLGGGFFAIANMMFPQQAKKSEDVSRFKSDSGETAARFREHIYFEMSHAQPWGKTQLECAVNVLGADHIIWGTSYPVRKEWLLEGADFVRKLDITEEQKNLMLGENAEKIYFGKSMTDESKAEGNDSNEAERYMKLAADAFYAHDREPDYEAAFKWATKAAEYDLSHAMTILGNLYLNGYYVELDFETARKWFEKAAEKEDMKAPRYLGMIYEKGLGVAADEEKAVLWYQAAAERGDITGQYLLGLMYEQGRGVAQSLEKAVEWYRISAKRGDKIAEPAIKALKRLGVAGI